MPSLRAFLYSYIYKVYFYSVISLFLRNCYKNLHEILLQKFTEYNIMSLMRYKKLTSEQILISIDRLTRFKFTKEKYLRVFTDIILSNLIEPKIKKNELLNMDFAEICDYAAEIFNGSLEQNDDDFTINLRLADYENSVFNNDDETQKLLQNKLNYKSAIKYIDDSAPVNLKWLKSLGEQDDLVKLRETRLLKYPIEKVLLVEGLTEEILLPAFSKFLGYDFYQTGIQVIAAGGKNQVVKMYYRLIEELKTPIFLLLDKDAEENIRQITPKLREIDKIHLVSCGEFEDLLPKSLIVKTVNSHFANFSSINDSDLSDDNSEVENLENIFKTKGLHEFKKAEFAKLVRENISTDADISAEIKEIIREIFDKNKTLDSKFCS